MKKIILASGSPRRKELLERMGIQFEILVSHKEEKITVQKPDEAVQELAKMKAYDIIGQVKGQCIVIGADTIVATDNNEILGKPVHKEHAFEMIKKIQGRTHKVYTGIAILEKKSDDTVKEIVFAEETKVDVVQMSNDEIEKYLNTKKETDENNMLGECLYEWQDKAGGYGIQGIFAKYISGICGDYYNVVGLPVCKLYQELNKMDI